MVNWERPRFDPWERKISWRRALLPTLVFLPGEFHGQRSLEGYSSWGHKEPDMTEQLTLSLGRVGEWDLWRWGRGKSLSRGPHQTSSEQQWKSLSRVQLSATPQNSPGKNTGVGSLSLLQGIFPTQESEPRIKPGSPALQVDSLPTELWGKAAAWAARHGAKGSDNPLAGGPWVGWSQDHSKAQSSASEIWTRIGRISQGSQDSAD